jgi:hypothetical protein
MRTVPPYVMEELARQRERELRKPGGRYGLLVPRRRRCRPACRRQNRGRIQPARTCPEGICPRAGIAGSGAV